MRVVTTDALVERLARTTMPNPRIVTSGNAAAPWSLLKSADAALETFRLFMLNAPPGIPSRDGVTHETPFVGEGMRGSRSLSYFPSRLSLVPQMLKTVTKPDVVFLNASLPSSGRVSLGVEVNVLPAAIEAARARGALVVAQLNASMPRTFGDSDVALDDIDLAIEVDEPLLEHTTTAAGPRHEAIGVHVAALVTDGATLQAGIGAIPDLVLSTLRTRKGLAIFSEMVSDSVMCLQRAGALVPGPLTTSFAIGSAELYEWLDRNGNVVFRRTEVTNNPRLIASQTSMTSINAAIEVDLFAQANASYVGGEVYSGFGGQSDFVEGALHAVGGQALIALPSWHEKTGHSTIVPRLGVPATSFQPSFVITERGAAAIWGRSVTQQREALIRIADSRASEVLAR